MEAAGERGCYGGGLAGPGLALYVVVVTLKLPHHDRGSGGGGRWVDISSAGGSWLFLGAMVLQLL